MTSEALIVEDDDATLDALATLVELEGFEVRTASRLSEAYEVLKYRDPQIILTDLMLPDGRGLDLLRSLPETTEAELVVITGDASLQTAVEALREGAYDYLTKPVDEARLKTLLANVRRTRDLKTEIIDLRAMLKGLGRFGKMVGTSEPMQKVYGLLEKVAPTEATVFLVGESGTGKELAAQTVHDLSRRKKAPFVAVNCGAVSPTLIESELFGHERGSFTGAERRHKGLFEQAAGGTLFLDEVTEMPLELQVKLLRVLETSKVTRVGGTESFEIDVRIVAATNRDPYEAVEGGRLREDLLYRLRVFPIDLPPLRARGTDIELLAKHFLARHLEEQGEDEAAAGSGRCLTQEALRALRRYSWPGNVRELRNAVQRAFIVADGPLDVDTLPSEIVAGSGHGSRNALEIRAGMTVAEVERLLIEVTMEAHDGDKKAVAEALGVSLKTLYNRLNSYAEGGSES